jgi:hypothetical protein
MVWVQLGFGTEFQLLARSAGLQFAGLWDRMGVAKLSTALPIREHCRLPTCDTADYKSALRQKPVQCKAFVAPQ